MILYVLNQSFNIIGVVDNYISVIWRPAYYSVGDFELFVNATAEVAELLKKDFYLVRDTDISVDENGNTSYYNVMIIKNFTLTTDVDEGDKFTITGRELKYILNKRIVWTQTNLSGTAENAIRRLVDENAIAPADTKRIIPALVLGAAAGLTDKIEKQITGDKLDEAITEICQTYSYGWEIFIYNTTMVLVVYQGVDRSFNQSERPYVVFSDDFDNILNSEYQFNTELYANTILVGGEGEGSLRKFVTVGSNYSGLERCETFADARDLSSNAGSPQEISADKYLALLEERGRENLAIYSNTEAFIGEIIGGSFNYNEDFYLGDKVTLINRYGISKDVIVLSAIESIDDSGVKLIPQFSI